MGAHWVYRCLDATGRALYVGCTKNLRARLDTHRRTAAWAPAVARVHATVHPDRPTALSVETAEIQRLDPRWNTKGRWANNVAWTDQDFADYLIARRAIGGTSSWVRRHLANVERIRRHRYPVRDETSAA